MSSGDKIHDPPDDPGFKTAAEAGAGGDREPGLARRGGPLGDAGAAQGADVALSVRHPRMIHSRELSTKVLEYGAAGCAVVLNRTPLYEELLGADYPLFVEEPLDALDASAEPGAGAGDRSAAAERCERASRQYSFEQVAAGWSPICRTGARAKHSSAAKLVIAGHDLRFVGPVRTCTRTVRGERAGGRLGGAHEAFRFGQPEPPGLGGRGPLRMVPRQCRLV